MRETVCKKLYQQTLNSARSHQTGSPDQQYRIMSHSSAGQITRPDQTRPDETRTVILTRSFTAQNAFVLSYFTSLLVLLFYSMH